MTPFTTWMVRLTDSPNMDHVNLENVDKITMTFIGSFLQGAEEWWLKYVCILQIIKSMYKK